MAVGCRASKILRSPIYNEPNERVGAATNSSDHPSSQERRSNHGNDRRARLAVVDEGDKGGTADGLESDAAGHLYATNYEHNAILPRRPDGVWETVAHDLRLLWPDTLSVAADGYLYVMANQLRRQARFHRGLDLRRKPYTLFRVRIDAQPVRLR